MRKDISNRVVETIRIQYVSGLYDTVKLVDRWVPEITIDELSGILDYTIKPDVKPELKPVVLSMGYLYDTLREALYKQSVKLSLASEELSENLEIEEFWGSIFDETRIEFPWLTYETFRKARAVSI